MIADFLSFRRMLAPWLIISIFWLGTAICVSCGIYDFFKVGILKGLAILLFGPLIIRLICESLIVFFRINETLTEIKNKLPRE